jgi:two-component system, OmpR family, phosphate regulon response regulator PhoB
MAKIIIIEDDPAFATALQRVIPEEHEVTLHPAVPEDDDLLFDAEPDLIFLDCMLPGETGPQLLERLRDDDRTRSVPVILMSGYEEMIDEAERLTGEYEEFLKKPCTMRQIMAVVQRHLGRTSPPSQY